MGSFLAYDMSYENFKVAIVCGPSQDAHTVLWVAAQYSTLAYVWKETTGLISAISLYFIYIVLHWVKLGKECVIVTMIKCISHSVGRKKRGRFVLNSMCIQTFDVVEMDQKKDQMWQWLWALCDTTEGSLLKAENKEKLPQHAGDDDLCR